MKTGIEVSKSIGTLLLLFTAALAQSPRFAPREKDCFDPVAPNGEAIVFDGDGDGVPDILVGSGGQLVFYRNDGRAHFTRGATSPGNLFAGTAVGDIDGDGDDDLFTTGVVRNLGNGQMATPVTVFPPSFSFGGPNWFFDADNDGDLDLIAKLWTGTRWATNDGTGTFTDRGFFVVPGGTILDMAILDVELDGDPDLVAATLSSPVLLRNDGSGTFAVDPNAFLGIPGTVLGIAAAADVDGDGYPDVVLRSPGNLVLRNDGGVHFTSTPTTGLPNEAFLQSWADWNQDGRVDLLTDRFFENVGNLSFTPRGAFARVVPPNAPWFADLDGDLDLDVVRGGSPVQVSLSSPLLLRHATTTATTQVLQPLVRSFRFEVGTFLLAEFAAGSLQPTGGVLCLFRAFPISGSTPTYSAEGVALSGQYTDAALVGGGVALCGPGGPKELINPGGPLASLPGATSSTHLDSGDLDLDTLPELILGDPNADGPEILRLSPTYSWVTTGRVPVPPATAHPSPARESVVVVDMDGDGLLDLVHELRVLRNLGGGAFAVGAEFAAIVGATTRRLLPFDLDGDGDQDLLAFGGSTTQLLRNDGTSFTDVSLGHLPTSEFGTTLEASAGDVDRDGDTDLLLCRNGLANLLRNDAGVFTRFPAIAPTGMLVDSNQDGWLDVFTGSQVYRNLHDHLWTPYQPALGVDWPIRIETWRQGPAAQFAVVAIGRPTLPVELPGLGTLGVDLSQPTAFYVEPLVGGQAEVSVVIPATPTALGLEIATQAVTVDALGLQLTQFLRETVL